MRWLLVVLVLGWWPAGAQAQDSEARRQAKSLKDTAVAAFERGQYQLALERFEEAYRIFPSPNLLYNIGRVQAALGRPLEAIASFEHFLAQARDVPEAARADARARIEELDKSVGRLVVASELAGISVSLDGRPAGITPFEHPLRAAPGEHTLAAERGGFQPLELRANVRAGETVRVRVDPKPIELHPAPAAAPLVAAASPPPEPDSGGTRPMHRRWWLWGLIGAAAAGTLVAVVAASSSDDSLPSSKLGVVRPQF